MAEFTGYFQMAYVVDDLDTAIHQWIETDRVGPFFVLDKISMDDLFYRGVAAPLEARVGLCQIGDMQLEIIQQTSEGPSAYRDSVPVGQDAIHHIARITHDFDGELERFRRAGFEVAALGNFNGLRFAYVDTRATISVMTELIDYAMAQGMLDTFEMLAKAADDWDGTDPIRQIEFWGASSA